MTEKRSYDAVFIGGGIVGLCCAWLAARRGAEVVILDARQPPAGATRVAAGMLAPVGELSFGEPELLEMTLRAAELYPRFVAELEAVSGIDTGYRCQGALHVALDRDEAAELRRRHELQRSLGLEAEWLPPRRCRELEPGLTPSFSGGVHAPGEASVDPRQLTSALLTALAKEGAEVRTGTEVVAGIFEGDERAKAGGDADGGDDAAAGTRRQRPTAIAEARRLRGVRTADDEEWRAESTVLAAGAWSGRVEWLPEAARPPVRPVKGQVLELRTRDGAAPCSRILASERVYLVPRPDGRLIVGATVEEQGFDTTVLAGGVHELLREAYRLLPEVAEMELIEAAAGLRPGTPDNLPLVTPGAIDGLLLATGHYRNGILLAPLAAETLADLLAGAGADPDRLPFAAQRATNDNRSGTEASASEVAG